MSELERALSRLNNLVSWADEHRPEIERNEATTRFALIDRLLTNVLGWPTDQVKAEDAENGGYADYVLGRPKRQLVVEAKREGHVFRLPAETPVLTSLPNLFKIDAELKAVVEQARGYAHDRGLPYAAVANGEQLVIFLANRTDGIPPLKGRALAFASFEAMQGNFGLLWDGLSRAGIDGRRLSGVLSEAESVPPPMKLSNIIPGYPAFQTPGELNTDLKMLGELFLIDLVQQEQITDEFLRQCYCVNGALSQVATVSRDILKKRYSETLGADLEVALESARPRRGVSPQMLQAATDASLSTRPIVLLGYVGVGKSMFIRHLVRVEAKAVFDHALVLYIDLGAEPALEELKSYVTTHFATALRDEHGVSITESAFVRDVYDRDLQEFRKGVWGELAEQNAERYLEKEVEHLAALVANSEQHLRRSLEHLAVTQRRQIVTILDNVDQREPEFQDQVFLLSEAFAKTWPGTVFVTLRPDTFNRSRRSGTLKAYQPRVFAVAPPRVDRVIQKRLAFAHQQITAHGRLGDQSGALRNTDAIDHYVTILTRSFRRRHELVVLVDNLSGGNVRRALDLLTTFISSPHASPERALKTYLERGGYLIPYHVFLRTIMLGDRRHYDPASSLVANLLDISSDDRREHFLTPIILSLVHRTSEPGVHEGYVPAERIYSFCQELGFTPGQITWQLDRATAADMLEVSPLDGAPEFYRATTIGSYTEQHLLGEYTYINEIVVDTPVVDDIARGVLDDVQATSRQLQRAEGFLTYLDEAWKLLTGHETGFDWTARSRKVRGQMQSVGARLPSQLPGRVVPREVDT